ncbi:hypothetical protein MHYP_G00252690 [Metynnis hypsauchen]
MATHEAVSTTEEEAIKTLVHLHLAGWRELQAVFQDAKNHWKQLEEQQVATRQMTLVCVGAGASLSPPLNPPVPAPRRTRALLPPPILAPRVLVTHLLSPSIPAPRALGALLPSPPVPALRGLGAHVLSPPFTATEDATKALPAVEALPATGEVSATLTSPTLSPCAGSFPRGVPSLSWAVWGMWHTPDPRPRR